MTSKGQICREHNECTDCPIRKICNIRGVFYSDAAYEDLIQDTVSLSTIVLRLQGVPESAIQNAIQSTLRVMNHRRQVEVQLHPTYSEIQHSAKISATCTQQNKPPSRKMGWLIIIHKNISNSLENLFSNYLLYWIHFNFPLFFYLSQKAL